MTTTDPRPSAVFATETCTGVWPSTPACTGWTRHGHHLHGCELVEGHHGLHRCRCSASCARVNDLDPPKFSDGG